MPLQLTTRKSIKWEDNEPSEPTSTLVLDIGVYFLDLRINKHDSSLDWGMCGVKKTLSEDPLTFQWTKEICSNNSESSDDIADFTIFPNGDAFEKGEMPNPAANNTVQRFEEIWTDVPFFSSFPPSSSSSSSSPVNEEPQQPAWVLRRRDETGITFAARIGDHFQVLRKAKGHDTAFSARREESVNGTWTERYVIGREGSDLISLKSLGVDVFDARKWKVGDSVEVGGRTYEVLAMEEIEVGKEKFSTAG